MPQVVLIKRRRVKLWGLFPQGLDFKNANDASGDESSSGTKRQTDKMTHAIRPLWRSNGYGQITGVCQALILIVVVCVFMRRVQDAARVEAFLCLVCVYKKKEEIINVEMAYACLHIATDIHLCVYLRRSRAILGGQTHDTRSLFA